MENIQNLIAPKSIAIIGVSGDPKKIGYQILSNIKTGGYGGLVFPVNPKYEEILDYKVYPDVREIKDEIDLAIIVIPAMNIEEVLRNCGAKKVKSVIVISAGFAESGEVGKQRQEAIISICKENGILMLGPNCLGLINSGASLNASFAIDMPHKGNISFMSQSGAIISAIIDWSKNNYSGFNKIFSLGNKAMLSEGDLLEYLYTDDTTNIIALYLEQLYVDSRLTSILKKNSKIKPTIVLFGGKTSFGASAAASHTGSIVTSYIAVQTYLKQSGVIIAENLNHFFNLCETFNSYTKINGKRIALITNAGGPGIAASDSAFSNQLELPELSTTTKERLQQFLPPEASLKNPVDLLGDADDQAYKNAIETVLQDENIDGAVVLLTPQTTTKIIETADVISNIKSDKPVLSSFVGGVNVLEGLKRIKRSAKPSYHYPEEAIRSIKALADYSLIPAEIESTDQIQDKIFLSEEKEKLLREYDLPVLEYINVDNEGALIDAANKIGYPLVVKISDETAHKSDTGGVILNIDTEEKLKEAFYKLDSKVIVGKMLKAEKEIFVGVKRDENVGVIVTFGTGGIFSEILSDFSYRIAPFSKEVALEMIHETKIGQIMMGVRNQKMYDLLKLSELLVSVSWFALEHQNIKEIDLNPVIASRDDYYIVDARIIENKEGTL